MQVSLNSMQVSLNSMQVACLQDVQAGCSGGAHAAPSFFGSCQGGRAPAPRPKPYSPRRAPHLCTLHQAPTQCTLPQASV